MHTVRRALPCEATILVALALLTARGGAAQVFATLYSFKGSTDGGSPNGVIFGKNGSLYGTTYAGGTNMCDFGSDRQREAWRETAGAWNSEDHPELAQGAAAWIRQIRERDNQRFEELERRRDGK
jgi:hypothetical protein